MSSDSLVRQSSYFCACHRHNDYKITNDDWCQQVNNEYESNDADTKVGRLSSEVNFFFKLLEEYIREHYGQNVY